MRLELAISELRGVLGGARTLLAPVWNDITRRRHAVQRVAITNRGLAVRQAIIDALGPVLQRSITDPVALGETLARLPGKLYRPEGIIFTGGHLHDPERYPSRAAFLTSRDGARETPQWPAWRRVDVIIEGVLAARFRVHDDAR